MVLATSALGGFGIRRLMVPPRVGVARLCHVPGSSQEHYPIQIIDESELDAWPSRWVLFTDLHVQRSTLPVCVQVLRKVAQEAQQRQAGVICLGDFWHAGGVLQTRALNRILSELRDWGETTPMLMIPGNHDQSMRGDPSPLLHALTPLQLARPSSVRVFSRPTLLGDSLWVPYGTTAHVLRAASSSAEAALGGRPLSAVFCHADVVGGLMNEGVAASQGLPPIAFPPLPTIVYSGHYHKPHVVPEPAAKGAAYPLRRLVLPDVDGGGRPAEGAARARPPPRGGQVDEEIPLDLGPRHHILHSPAPHELAELETSLRPRRSSARRARRRRGR